MVTACVVVPIVADAFEPPEFGAAYTLMFGFTRPRSRGRVWLTSADPAAAPAIDPNYLAEEYDRETYLEAMDRARALGWTHAFDDWRKAELYPGPDLTTKAARLEFLAQAAFTHHHPVGTCRMGQDALAVVGPDLKVRGVDGLHVVDGSIIPHIPSGPNNAAIIAIAERASDVLREVVPLAS